MLKQVIKDIDGNIEYYKNGTPVKRYDYKLINDNFDKKDNNLPLVHTFISNIKAVIHGIYHGFSIAYLDLIVEEFTWRYNLRTCNDNHKKMLSLIKSIFKTPVRTSRQFKEYYFNLS